MHIYINYMDILKSFFVLFPFLPLSSPTNSIEPEKKFLMLPSNFQIIVC